MKYAYVDENPYYKNTFKVVLNPHLLEWGPLPGNIHILAARLLNMSYQDYLRFCRDSYNGELIGKKDIVPRVVFKDRKSAEKIAKLLNERMEIVVNEKAVPYN